MSYKVNGNIINLVRDKNVRRLEQHGCDENGFRQPDANLHHDQILRAAFGGTLSEDQISALIAGSLRVDEPEFQDPRHSYMHAMTGINYVKNGNVDAAKALSAQLMNGFIYQQGYIFDKNLASNNEYLAYFNLGMGMLPLTDQWSPAHGRSDGEQL